MCSNTETTKIGDVVLVQDDVPRSLWKLANVKELHRSSDGNVRSAEIYMNNRVTTRPIVKLYPLEVRATLEDSTEQGDTADRPFNVLQQLKPDAR